MNHAIIGTLLVLLALTATSLTWVNPPADVHTLQEARVAHTTSMGSFLTQGDKVYYIYPQDISSIATGDVIVYAQNNIRIVHRVVASGYDMFGWYALTKGDANSYIDPHKVREESLLGKVIFVEPK